MHSGRQSIPSVVGVVIAGGRSVRFNGEKAVAKLADKPLLTWAVQRLQAICERVGVNVRPGTEVEALARTQGLTLLYDAPGDPPGPLAGVKAGLRWAKELGVSALAVSPCDVPLLPDDLFVRLLREGGDGAAMAETLEGHQPLCSIWPVSALEAVTASLHGGSHPATWRLLDSIGAKRVRFEHAEAFANVNTRADLAMLAERLETARK